MAKNIILEPGYQQAVVCDSPATPASGDPIRYGKLTGIAEVDEGDGGNDTGETSVDFGPMVVDVSVDDNEGTGIAVGDPIYFHDTATGTPATHLNNSATAADAFFGIAEEVVSANATPTIKVFHFPVGLTGTMSGSVAAGQIAANAVTAAKVATSAEDDLTPGIAVEYQFNMADGATANVDKVLALKTVITDVEVIATSTNGSNANTVQVDNGTSGSHVTDAISTNGKVTGDIVRAANITIANQVIAAGGTLRIIRTKAGGTHSAKVIVRGHISA